MKSTSVKEIIARIVRNTRLQDSSYLDDMLEWIPEAMGLLQTRYQLKADNKELKVYEHVSEKLPCGLVHIDAVELLEIDGSEKVGRLPEGSEIRKPLSADEANKGIWRSVPIVNEITIEEEQTLDDGTVVPPGIYREYTSSGNQKVYIPKSGQDITKWSPQGVEFNYYKKELDYIQTSFETGKIKVHYLGQPIDKDGYPLVPDIEEYKTALYWYVRMMMIGTGYKDPMFDYTFCEERWSYFQGRAISKITWPSVDRMERIKNATVRLIPPADYWKEFHANYEQRETIAR
jgi:hypothetical protein